MSKDILKNAIKLLYEARSNINKSESDVIQRIESSIDKLEELEAINAKGEEVRIIVLVILHDIISHLPSILELINSLPLC